MKPFSLSILLIIFSVHFLFSQNNRLFHDDFSANTNHWETSGTDAGKAVIKNGSLNLSGGNGYLKCLHEVWMKNGHNFTLETHFTINPGPQPNAFGILWSGSDRMDSYYAFLVQPSGYFGVVEVINGIETVLVPWKKHRKIKGPGEVNQIAITKVGWKLTFWINEKDVAEMRFKKFLGKYQGLMLRGKGNVSVDDFTVRHPDVSLNLMGGNYPIARKRRLDSTVNSPDFDETNPILDPSNRTLYFTRKPVNNDWDQGDIWVSHVQGDTMWGEPVKAFYPQ